MSEKAASKRIAYSLKTGPSESEQLRNLRSAVETLYYAAVWHADRPIKVYVSPDNSYGDFEPASQAVEVGEAGLWEAVRNAAGFRQGNSPKEIPYQGVKFEFPLDRIRILANTNRKRNDFSTEQVNAFLALFREEFEARVNKAAREFIEEKLG